MARVSFLLVLCLLLESCSDTHETLGEAYVAPAKLHIRGDLSLKSNTVADLKHGTPVSIIDVQRRMVKIRTREGVQGWVDSLDLLSGEQMNAIHKKREQEALLPSEAAATAYEPLNIHIDPSRASPAFAQIPEGGAVSVLGHRLTPKVAGPVRTNGLVAPRASSPRKQHKEQKDHGISFRLPPQPAAPKPPANWQELSAERIDGGERGEGASQAGQKPPPKPVMPVVKAAPPKPVVLEDWSLIKTKANEIGWVLSRNLLMSIPDEVAQYAEGKHITAFFDLGVVNDEVKGQKHNWLWTTAASGLPYDFDSWRVFLWNARRHRYETSFRQRDLVGSFPVHVDAADPSSLLRSFEIITKDDDAKLRRRTYSFDGHLVHLTGTEDYNGEVNAAANAVNGIDPAKLPVAHPGWFKRQWSQLRHRLFGR